MIKMRSNKIGLVSSVAFAVGAMVGGGVFALTGVALQQTGPSALISFILAGGMVLLSAFSFTIIASMATSKQPGYSYVGKVLGHPIWGFLTSWCFYLAGIIGAAFVLNAFGAYMHEFVTPTIAGTFWALGGAVLLMLVNLGPASAIGRIEVVLVGGKLIILAALVIAGLFHFHSGELHPFVPHGEQAIFTSSALLFIAFLGFNVITNMASDIKNPRQTIPRAIFISMLIVTLVYFGVTIALLSASITNYTESSVGTAARQLMGPIGGGLVVAGALISTLSSGNASILGTSEIMVRLAAIKQVPTIMGHMTHGHPYVSVIGGAILSCLLLLSGQSQIVINLANVTALFALIIVNLAAARALASKGHLGKRFSFRWLIPILGVIGVMVQFLFIPLTSIVIGLALGLSGIILYLLRHRLHHSRFHRQIVATVDIVQGPLGRSLH